MSDDRIDFAALDPARNTRRWEQLVQRTLEGAHRESAWLSARHLRPAVAAAVVIALLSWLPTFFADERVEAVEPALAVVQYAHGGDVTALLESLDGS